MSGGGLRIVLADDDVLLREGMASLLGRSGMQVVGQAGDAVQLLALVAEHAPDVVVVDVRMPPTRTTEGLDAAREIREQHPEIGILVLSAHADVEQAVGLLATGRAVGYLLKDRVVDMAEFADTLDRIARGGSVVDPALVQELVMAGRRHDPLDRLSGREREVLALITRGLSNAEIAMALSLAESTVKTHLGRILTKLGLRDRVQAVILGYECGLGPL